ncbi:excalibur calcium-binding domain-containing protein [Roseateles sp. DC23W]|uniref:Excalibur calcium-binding domain-containing protein n=1 Tax=Pelomonas dachongensis TaxID=3299029 RepID=A0ABW7ETZ1_9BURK
MNGTTTYQQSPCPANQARKEPTLQELNDAEKKRKASAAISSASAASANAVAPSLAPARATGFHCDGRQHCSQMTSCAEAKQFLANCPGVKMDGDRNGIPCEKQWCSR